MGTALTLPWGGAGGMAEAATGAFFFSFFSFLFGHPTAHGIPRPGISSEPQLQPTPDPYPPVPGQESNLRPSAPETQPIHCSTVGTPAGAFFHLCRKCLGASGDALGGQDISGARKA